MIPTSLPIYPFLMVAVFGLPLALGIGLKIKRRQPAIVRLAPWSALPALAAVTWVPSDEIVSIPWILLEMHLAMDLTGPGGWLLRKFTQTGPNVGFDPAVINRLFIEFHSC